jgi:hypothetical protein
MTASDGAHIFPPRADDQRIIDAIAAQGGPFGFGVDGDFRRALGQFLSLSDDKILATSTDDMWRLYLDSVGLVNAAEPFDFALEAAIVAGRGADNYVSNGVTNNPEGVSGSTRSDIWWDQSGLQVYTYRSTSPRYDQYDVSPAWSVDPGAPSTWTNRRTFQNTPVQGTNGNCLQIFADGTGYLRGISSGGNTFLQTFALGTVHDISTSALVTNSALTILGAGGGISRYGPDEESVFVALGGATPSIRKYALPQPSLLTGAVAGFDFDPIADTGGIQGFCISGDGLFLYAARNSDKRLVSWEFANPFDMSSVVEFQDTSGPLLNAGSNFFVPAGFQYRNDNGDITLGDSLKSGSANQRMQVLSIP